MRTVERNDPSSVISRVAAILSAFKLADENIGVSELSRRTDLPKTTVHRLCRDLVAHRMLERDGNSLRLGLRLFELGEQASHRRNLSDVALPIMADLRGATRQTVHLAVLDGTEVVYIQILREKSAPRLPSRVGGRLPAHATAIGKAMLAFSSPDVVDAVIGGGLARLGPRTTVAPVLLRRDLARIRASGIAQEHEESGAGIVCAASPVLDDDGSPRAAVSISGWVGQLNPSRMAPAVKTAALSIARALHQGAYAPA